MTSTFTSALAADSAGDAVDTDRLLLSAATLLDQSPSGGPLSGTGISENARISLVYSEERQASASLIPTEQAYDRAVDQVMDALARPADQNEEGPPPGLEFTLDGIDDLILEDLTVPLI